MEWKEKSIELFRRIGLLLRAAGRHTLRLSRRALEGLRTLWRDPRTCAILLRLRQRSLALWRGLGLRLVRVAAVGALVALVTVGVGRLALHRVAPGEVGVRVSDWGGDGVTRQDFGPGLHLGITGVHSWHRMPSGTDWIAWRATSEEEPGSMLGVRTQDGNEVFVALAVPYHIRPGEAHEIVAESNRNTYRGMVAAKTETLLLAELGQLSSEQFTDTDSRNAVLEGALVKLNESLAGVHVEAEAVLVEDVRFPGPYEKKLQETQLEKLRGKMLAASQAVSEEEQIIARKKLETERELQDRRVELERGILEVKLAATEGHEELERETARYVAEQRALAEREYEALALAGKAKLLEAEALEDKLENEIYASEGGRLYLATLAAEATHIQAVTLDANDPRVPNVLDPDAMTELFIGE